MSKECSDSIISFYTPEKLILSVTRTAGMDRWMDGKDQQCPH